MLPDSSISWAVATEIKPLAFQHRLSRNCASLFLSLTAEACLSFHQWNKDMLAAITLVGNTAISTASLLKTTVVLN